MQRFVHAFVSTSNTHPYLFSVFLLSCSTTEGMSSPPAISHTISCLGGVRSRGKESSVHRLGARRSLSCALATSLCRMAHRYVRKLRLATATNTSDVRHLHSTSSCHHALAGLYAEYSTASSSSSSEPYESPLDILRKQKAEDIRSLLSLRRPAPNRVWATYVELLQFYDAARVPLDIHQSVLRKCTPPVEDVRAAFFHGLASGRKYVEHCVYETRFQRIIRNIRNAGEAPALEDYHCVLELFAAIGNHESAMMVLREIGRVGLAKEPKTYALCLQALCHRLTLPIWHLDRPALVDEVTKHCMSIVQDMASNGVPYASYNVDLVFRILKETLNMEGFTTMMRMAYGLDLDYPDRSPLEFWDKARTGSTDVEVPDGAPVQLPTRLPYTQAAFHTTLDYLGRTGNISKLVQTFEVVTTPLPSSTSNPAFDEDDEDDFGVSNPQVAPFKPPHVQPNTTSFTIMLRWVARARHFVLARHYVLVAIQQEREQNRQLREWARTRSPADIPAPRLTINRSLLLPVFWLANRNKKMGMLRWLQVKTRRAIRQKRFHVEEYSAIRERWVQSGVHHPKLVTDEGMEDDPADDLPEPAASSQFTTYFNPSSTSRQTSDASPGSAGQLPHFAVDLDAPLVPPVEEKKLDIDLHLALLRRDLDGLEELATRLEDVIARSTQRVKERLGRRVWGGKNIFLSDASRRTLVPREVWRETVNFVPQSVIEEKRLKARRARVAKTRERQRLPDALSLLGPAPQTVDVVVDGERDSSPQKSKG